MTADRAEEPDINGRRSPRRRTSSSAARRPRDVSEWNVLPEGEPMGIDDIRDALVIRERSTFMLTDEHGNIPPGNAQGYGVYQADTRHLSAYGLRIDGQTPVTLLSTAELGYAMEQVMTTPEFTAADGRTIRRGSMEIRRQRVVSDVIEEFVRVSNFNPYAITIDLAYEFAADFADIFDVRGYRRMKHGVLDAPAVRERSVFFRYVGIDERERTTRIAFDIKPRHIDAGSAHFTLKLRPRQTASVGMRIGVDEHLKSGVRRNQFNAAAGAQHQWIEGCTQVETDNEIFNRVLRRSLLDVHMLLSETERSEPFVAAGTPWFDALFGRDSCIVAMQLMAFRPDLARTALRLLARWQGSSLTAARDEEPGKILHELRVDELSRADELPYGPYYGSIDSTPLFLMLAAEYFQWTADIRLIRQLHPAIVAACDWMEQYGDPTGEHYLSYEKRSVRGLVNQGWKDSWDAVVHDDGSLARPPIALAEVQGYAYAARARIAPLLERLGDTQRATRLRRDARRMYDRFNDEFWIAERRYFALARDGAGEPVESITTNPAHCLWSGLIDPRRAADVASRLMSPDMFSGWGLRTLSETNPRFNPIGYHLGTVWPHDNSIAAMGFKMYGLEHHTISIASALFEAATAFPYFRLPELFGGQARAAHHAPVPYPVACRPQAWAAGAFPLMTQAILGIKAEAAQKRLRVVNPRLPHWLNSVRVSGLRVGGGYVALQYRRDGPATRIEVQEASGVDVVVSTTWPRSEGATVGSPRTRQRAPEPRRRPGSGKLGAK